MKTFNIRYRSVGKLKDFLLLHDLIGQDNLLVQIFTSLPSSKIEKLLDSLRTLIPSATIVGCSTDGEVINGKIVEKNTAISITQFEKTKLTQILLESKDDAYAQGKEIVKKLLKKETKAIILFATFKDLDAPQLLEGIHENASHKNFVLSGALAADNGQFSDSYVFDANHIQHEGIVAVALSGKSLIANNYHHHDWEPVSRKFKVNKVVNHRVFMIDDKPIKSLYANYVALKEGDSLPLQALQFPFVCLHKGRYVSKLALASYHDGSLLFASKIKKGEILHIGYVNIEKVHTHISELFQKVSQEPVETLFVYASSARRRFLAQLAHKEIDVLQQIESVSGFFGFGEFFIHADTALFSSQSFTALALSESTKVKDITYVEKKSSQHDFDYKTTQVLSNIAQVSSSELEEVNKKLERRVRDEVRENRKKDSLMIHNSKLAQLGEMMGLIAHQWRQPLSSISAAASGMQIKFELETASPAYIHDSLENIEKYVTHLSETINDFTNFFKPSKKKESIEARELIKKALFILSPLLTKESVLVIKKYNSQNTIITYPNEVVQVLLNILNNAVNALLKRKVKNPEIYIFEYLEKGKNIIEISDNAGGIDKAIMDKIFEPYFSTNNHESTMGLGLYMSKFIIEESCGGTISVANTDEGVKFTIIL